MIDSNSPWRNLFEQLQDMLSRIGISDGAMSIGKRIVPVQQNPKPSAEVQRDMNAAAKAKREQKAYYNKVEKLRSRRPEWREPKPSGPGPKWS